MAEATVEPGAGPEIPVLTWPAGTVRVAPDRLVATFTHPDGDSGWNRFVVERWGDRQTWEPIVREHRGEAAACCESAFPMPEPLTNGRYRWRVRSETSSAVSDWSDHAEFVVDAPAGPRAAVAVPAEVASEPGTGVVEGAEGVERAEVTAEEQKSMRRTLEGGRGDGTLTPDPLAVTAAQEAVEECGRRPPLPEGEVQEHTGWVRADEGQFVVGDRGVFHEQGRLFNGVVSSGGPGAVVRTGIAMGGVRATVRVQDRAPSSITGDGWDDVAEVSIPVRRLPAWIGSPMSGETSAIDLSAVPCGMYRLRVHARGRELDYDDVVERSSEEYLLVLWPAPAGPDVVHAGNG